MDMERFRRVIGRRPRLVDRLFTETERADAARMVDPTHRLAARFAAKEAVMKALGVGIGALRMREVEVLRTESGAPDLVLAGRAAALAANKGIGVWHVSLTHTELVAIASVVAVGPNGDAGAVEAPGAQRAVEAPGAPDPPSAASRGNPS